MPTSTQSRTDSGEMLQTVGEIGVDIGGTFTDVVALDFRSGIISINKTLSTPQLLSQAAVQGVVEVLGRGVLSLTSIRRLCHASTVVANTVIQRRGARTALVATRGTRDVLAIRREHRYDVHDLSVDVPPPLVPRRLRFEVDERLGPGGSIVEELDEEQATALAVHLKSLGIESVAVCLLHSFRNPIHERRIKAILAEECPTMLVSISSDVVPEIREYERTSTTVINAYTKPIVSRYLRSLGNQLRQLGLDAPVFVMLSGGGMATIETAGEFPVRMAESGPVAGALAARYWKKRVGVDKVISLDMGGTTAKACLISGDDLPISRSFEIARTKRFKPGSGLAVQLPAVDVVEIGAGGGSIAYVDDLGMLRVGPQSAEADPGPACYSKGGSLPTVTDADLLLGFLNPDYFLGGRMRLDLEAAEQAIRQHIAEPLGISLVQACWGIFEITNENMATAARTHAIERGYHPAESALLAFGGAGPVHAFGVARKLGCRDILVPPMAGVASSFGLLVAPLSFHFARGYMCDLSRLDRSAISRLLDEMREDGERVLQQAGVRTDDRSFAWAADLRYKGQTHEITVPFDSTTCHQGDFASQLSEAFETRYELLFGRSNPGFPVEVLNWRGIAYGPTPVLPELQLNTGTQAGAGPPLKGTRAVYFGDYGKHVECKVYSRYHLHPEMTIEGPAIVEEEESTTVIGRDSAVRLDDAGTLRISLEA